MKSPARVFSTLLSSGLLLMACVPADPVDNGTGGKGVGSGGAPGTGGMSAGTGGAIPGSGGSGTGGAFIASGGAPGTGGRVSSSGGQPGSGGSISTGGDGTGGRNAGTGGRSAATGGRSAGGNTGTGGGAAGMTGAAGNAGTYAAVAAIIGASCGTGTCHQGGNHTDLRNNAGLFARMVGAMPTGTMSEVPCRTRILVVANDPGMSVLSQVIKARVTGCTGARMPDNCSTTSTNPRPCLTTAQIATIDSWIAAGANP